MTSAKHQDSPARDQEPAKTLCVMVQGQHSTLS